MSSSLPSHYMITGKFAGHDEFRQRLEQSLAVGNRVVQLRCKGMGDDDYLEVARLAEQICRSHDALLLLATSVSLFERTGADGLHLSSDKLSAFSERPIDRDKLLSVSCHSREDLEMADRVGADILLLSPVKPTSSHPELPGLGWVRFYEMTKDLSQPVYGLGGMKPEDVGEAVAAGAQGIAATKGYW